MVFATGLKWSARDQRVVHRLSALSVRPPSNKAPHVHRKHLDQSVHIDGHLSELRKPRGSQQYYAAGSPGQSFLSLILLCFFPLQDRIEVV